MKTRFGNNLYLWILLTPLWSTGQITTEYRNFTVEQLSPGVYAAIHRNGGHAVCNAGIVDLGDEVLIFDPFLSLEAAQELKKAATELTGKQVKYVVNSHFHNDHTRGNQIFRDATIISTTKTAELMKRLGPSELEIDQKEAKDNLQTWKNKQVDSTDQHALYEKIGMIGYYEAIVQSLPDIVLTYPEITFDQSMVINGSRLNVKLISLGEGHTTGDAIMVVGKENILFAGDLVFVQTQPWMADGNPKKWIRSIDRISKMNPSKIVPGHGIVTTTDGIKPLREYLNMVIENADQIAAASPDKQSAFLKCPAPYNKWMLSFFYAPNVINLSKKESAPDSKSKK